MRQPRPNRLPLSHAQTRLWFLNRLDGAQSLYNLPMAMRMDGDLRMDALEAALVDVVARHESLRVLFPDEGGVPYQEIISAAEARPIITHESLAEDAMAARLAAVVATLFDLAHDLPLRAWVFGLSPTRHVFLLLLHHIVADGWSLGPLARDLSAAYAARSEGMSPGWTELPVQYADYTLWQRAMLGSDDDPTSPISRQLAFWRNTLDGAPEELESSG